MRSSSSPKTGSSMKNSRCAATLSISSAESRVRSSGRVPFTSPRSAASRSCTSVPSAMSGTSPASQASSRPVHHSMCAFSSAAIAAKTLRRSSSPQDADIAPYACSAMWSSSMHVFRMYSMGLQLDRRDRSHLRNASSSTFPFPRWFLGRGRCGVSLMQIYPVLRRFASKILGV